MLMLRLIRVASGLTQLELSRRAGLSSTRVSMLERAIITPAPAEAEALGRVLGTPPEELFASVSLPSPLGRAGDSGRPTPAGCAA